MMMVMRRITRKDSLDGFSADRRTRRASRCKVLCRKSLPCVFTILSSHVRTRFSALMLTSKSPYLQICSRSAIRMEFWSYSTRSKTKWSTRICRSRKVKSQLSALKSALSRSASKRTLAWIPPLMLAPNRLGRARGTLQSFRDVYSRRSSNSRWSRRLSWC